MLAEVSGYAARRLSRPRPRRGRRRVLQPRVGVDELVVRSLHQVGDQAADSFGAWIGDRLTLKCRFYRIREVVGGCLIARLTHFGVKIIDSTSVGDRVFACE